VTEARLNDSKKHLLKKAAWRCCMTTYGGKKTKKVGMPAWYHEGSCLFFWRTLLPQRASAEILKNS